MSWIKETAQKFLRNHPICKMDNEAMIDIIEQDKGYGKVIIFRCPHCSNAKIVMLREKKELAQWL